MKRKRNVGIGVKHIQRKVHFGFLLTSLLAGSFVVVSQALAVAAWQVVGSTGLSVGTANYDSLAFNGDTPYVAFQDLGNSSKATVEKFDGTNWVPVGTAGFSAGRLPTPRWLSAAAPPTSHIRTERIATKHG
ncbi:MAG: hypothetical protein WDN27_04555 [Candidatus Saccharibacteria bacterium]